MRWVDVFSCHERIVREILSARSDAMWEWCKSFIHLPLLFALLLGGGSWICYGIATGNKHVVLLPDWPFVSDTGAKPPESCLFTLLLTWSAFAVLATVYSYYKYVLHCDNQSKCNVAALIAGSLAAFGITMVAAFQISNILIPHIIGAGLAFLGAVVYSIMVVHISWNQLSGRVHFRNIVYVRIAIVVVELASLVVMCVGGILMQISISYRNIATISEWFLIYFATIFIGTLAFDLRRIRGASMRIKLFDRHAADLSLESSSRHSREREESPPKSADDFVLEA